MIIHKEFDIQLKNIKKIIVQTATTLLYKRRYEIKPISNPHHYSLFNSYCYKYKLADVLFHQKHYTTMIS